MRAVLLDEYRVARATWDRQDAAVSTVSLMAHTPAGVLVARTGTITAGLATLAAALESFRSSWPDHRVTVSAPRRAVELTALNRVRSDKQRDPVAIIERATR